MGRCRRHEPRRARRSSRSSPTAPAAPRTAATAPRSSARASSTALTGTSPATPPPGRRGYARPSSHPPRAAGARRHPRPHRPGLRGDDAVAVLTPTWSAFAQVGDGAIVTPDGTGEWAWLFWPQRGEYANSTSFLTDPTALDSLQVDAMPGGQAEVALFTDGLQHLLLDYEQQQVHSPFFEQMLVPVRASAPAGEDPALSAGSWTTWAPHRSPARADDDLTLLLGHPAEQPAACARRPPVPGRPGCRRACLTATAGHCGSAKSSARAARAPSSGYRTTRRPPSRSTPGAARPRPGPQDRRARPARRPRRRRAGRRVAVRARVRPRRHRPGSAPARRRAGQGHPPPVQPRQPADQFPNADWRFLVHVATNVARAFATVHASGWSSATSTPVGPRRRRRHRPPHRRRQLPGPIPAAGSCSATSPCPCSSHPSCTAPP